MRQPVDVEIMGQQLLVTSDEGPAHVRAVALFVDETMRTMAADAGAVATLDVALLAALNIASEYHKLRDQYRKQSETIERLVRRLTSELPNQGERQG